MKWVDRRMAPLLALVVPFVALAIQLVLWPYISPFVWFLFFPAVFISSWLGGLRPGLGATVISAVLVWFFFVPPRYTFDKFHSNAFWTLLVFLVMGVLFSVFQERLRAANARTSAALAEVNRSNLALTEANTRVTELLEQTRELDRVKSAFFANISHELRTPLTLITAPVERQLAQLAEDDPRRPDLELMQRNAQLLLLHVNNLLDAARLEAGHVEPAYSEVDLSRLGRLTASLFESRAIERGIEFRVDLPETAAAQADAEQVQRVLINLLGNAFNATPRGGAVRLHLREVDGWVRLEVADSGPGVPVSERELIFERFRRGASKASGASAGTGLGLSIVRDLVTLHGGEIGVDDAPEGGALFTVTLPVHAPEGTVLHAEPRPGERVAAAPVLAAETAAPAAEQATGPESGAVVLVVEDNADMNRVISEALADRYRVLAAFDGQQGLAAARRHRPAVIVTDVMMPRGGGEELVDAVRGDPNLATTAILVVSARADDEGRLALLRAGANDYLVKPFAVHELQIRVANLVALQQAEEVQRMQDVIVDRERIACDLHDLVVQELFAAGMRLDGLVRKTDPDDLRAAVNEIAGQLDAAIATIRTTIYDLRHGGHSVGLRARVTELASEAAERVGCVPRITFRGPVDTVVDDVTTEHVLAVVREALSNIVRHAHATHFDVDLSITGSDVELTVCDDGVGVDAGARSAGARRGDGLGNMASRAAKLGGTCTVASQEPRGTRVHWTAPAQAGVIAVR